MMIFAREPVFNQNERVFAYQLNVDEAYEASFVDSWTKQQLSHRDGAVMPWSDLLEGFTSIIKVSNDMLVSSLPEDIIPEETLFELDDIHQPADLISHLKALKTRGFRFVASSTMLLDESSENLIDFVKIDPTQIATEAFEQQKNHFKAKKIHTIAIDIHDTDSFNAAKAAGFEYFQGFFFLDKSNSSKDELPASKIAVLRLLAEINKEELDMRKLESVIAQDATLSYLLFRYINNPMVNKYQEISSIRHALSYLGEVMIRKFIAIVSLAYMNADNAPELLQVSLVRARFCELLAEKCQVNDKSSSAFMTGLFSMLDIILGRPMPELMKRVSLATEVKHALINEEGHLFVMLVASRSIESAHWPSLLAAMQTLEIDKETINRTFIEAVRWANDCGIPDSASYPVVKPGK